MTPVPVTQAVGQISKPRGRYNHVSFSLISWPQQHGLTVVCDIRARAGRVQGGHGAPAGRTASPPPFPGPCPCSSACWGASSLRARQDKTEEARRPSNLSRHTHPSTASSPRGPAHPSRVGGGGPLIFAEQGRLRVGALGREECRATLGEYEVPQQFDEVWVCRSVSKV